MNPYLRYLNPYLRYLLHPHSLRSIPQQQYFLMCVLAVEALKKPGVWPGINLAARV